MKLTKLTQFLRLWRKTVLETFRLYNFCYYWNREIDGITNVLRAEFRCVFRFWQNQLNYLWGECLKKESFLKPFGAFFASESGRQKKSNVYAAQLWNRVRHSGFLLMQQMRFTFFFAYNIFNLFSHSFECVFLMASCCPHTITFPVLKAPHCSTYCIPFVNNKMYLNYFVTLIMFSEGPTYFAKFHVVANIAHFETC